MGKGLAPQGNAGPPGLIDAAVPAQELLTAVNQAAQRLGPDPVSDNLSPAEVLADPATCETAARWRAGNPARRLTSVLARMVQALQSYGGVVAGPVCPAAHRAAEGVASQECSAPKRRAGPLRGLEVVSTAPPSSSLSSTLAQLGAPLGWNGRALRARVLTLNWRTVLAVLVVLLFPRLVALSIAIFFRLMARAVMSLASHVLRELWFQLNATAAELEDALINWLYGQLGFANPYVQPPALIAHDTVPAPPPPPAGGGQSLPTRPMDLITCVLLVLNLRRPYGGGGGNGGPEG